MTEQALTQCEDRFAQGLSRELAIAVVEGHEGVIGISASRLKDNLDMPAFVLTHAEDGCLKGSGRSVPGFDLGASIMKAKREGILVKGGGHAMAGGITIEETRLAEFKDIVDKDIATSRYGETGVISTADIALKIENAGTGLVDGIGKLAPFGMGNPLPRVVLLGVRLERVRILKEKHLKCVFADPDLGGAGRTVEAPIWNAVGTEFGDMIQNAEGEVLDVYGTLEINEWQGRRKVQMKVSDLRASRLKR